MHCKIYLLFFLFFFFNDTATTEIYTLSLHDALPISLELQTLAGMSVGFGRTRETATPGIYQVVFEYENEEAGRYAARAAFRMCESIIKTGSYPSVELETDLADRKSTRLNSSH